MGNHLHEVVCWTSPERASFCAALLDAMSGDAVPVAFGGSRSTVTEADGAVADAARSLGLEPADDLRQALVETPPACLLVADADGVSEAAWAAARAARVSIVTLEPAAARLSLIGKRLDHAGRLPVLLPGLGATPGFVAGAQATGVLGQPRLIRLHSLGPAEHRDVFTRLVDLWRVALGYVAVPEAVSAALSHGPVPTPDAPRSLHGHLSVHARAPGGSAVLLHAASVDYGGGDQGGGGQGAGDQRADIFAAEADLTLTESGFRLIGRGGAFEDGSDAVGDPPASFVEQCVTQWRAVLGAGGGPIHGPASGDALAAVDRAADALACALACLLSARTGQSESPHTILQMGR